MTPRSPRTSEGPTGRHEGGSPTPTEPAGPALRAAYDGIISDLDGVVYRGQKAVPGAPEAFRRLDAAGVKVAFATNNASREPGDVAAQLTALGVPVTPGQIVTSAQAGAAQLAEELPTRSAVLALGGPGVAAALREVGLTAIHPDDAAANEPVSAVLQGFGRDLRVRDFETASRHLAAGAVWVATNTDATLPLEWGMGPGNGAYVRLLAAVAGRQPRSVGKPGAPLYRAAMSRLGTPRARTLAVGDRLDTDVDGAVAAGLDSAWVLTGVDRPSALLRRTGGGGRPTFVIGSLAELDEPYAAVLAARGAWTCGGTRVRVAGSRIQVDPSGGSRRIEAVRAGLAAAAAAIASGDAGGDPTARGALARSVDELWLDERPGGSPSAPASANR